MLKKMLVVALAVSLFGITGCPELKTLRQQNANLQAQLAESQQSLSDANASLATVTAARDQYKAQLAAAQLEGGKNSAVIKQLQDQQALLEKQRADLQNLLKNYTGIGVEERGDGNFIVMDNDILFDSGKADLKDKVKTALDKVADYLNKNPDVPIRVDGHSDATPIHVSQWQDNYELSAMRAHAVMKYLMSKGVKASRMYIVGYGPNRPRVTPPTPEAAVAANRRVEIMLVPKGVRSFSDILKDVVKE
jgi:chemotaxis protein MotB